MSRWDIRAPVAKATDRLTLVDAGDSVGCMSRYSGVVRQVTVDERRAFVRPPLSCDPAEAHTSARLRSVYVPVSPMSEAAATMLRELSNPK
jgi:hypothetical protein